MRRDKSLDKLSSTVECPICRQTLKHGLTGLSSHVRYKHGPDEMPRAWRPEIADHGARWEAYQNEFAWLWGSARTKGPGAKLPPSQRTKTPSGEMAATSGHLPQARLSALYAEQAPPVLTSVPPAGETFEAPCPTCHGSGKVKARLA